MQTALSLQMADDLSGAPLTRLLTFLDERIPAVEAEMKGWRDKLDKYEKEADNKFGHRKTGAVAPEDKTVFDLKNGSLNMVRGVARYMKGRCEGDIFGGSPWFYAKAEGLEDADLATGMQKHLDFKFRQAHYREAGKETIANAIDFGTAVSKTTWRITAEPFERLTTAFHGPDGEPVLHPDPADPSKGDYVEEGHPSLATDDAGNALYQPPNDPITGEASPTLPGRMKQAFITEPNVKYEGLSVETIPAKNLIAVMEIAKFEDGDIVGHKYRMPVLDIISHYAPDNSDPVLLAKLRNLQRGDNEAAVGDEKAKGDEMPTANHSADLSNPSLSLYELRVRFDPLNRGSRRIYVVYHLESRTIIHIDYQGNMTPGGDLDMHPVVINKVPGRWYGRGYFETYEMVQEMIDGTLNAIAYRNEFNANPVKILNVQVCEETMKTGEIDLFPGKVLRRNNAADPSQKLLELVELPDTDQRSWQILELCMQILQQDSGVTAAAQGDPGALPSVATATGTNAILSSGSTMHQLVIDSLKEGLEKALSFAMRLVYSRQDGDETYSYMAGSKALQGLLALEDAQTLAKLALHVSLSLTRIKNQELRDAAGQLIDRIIQYATLPPQVQINAQRGYIQFAQSLGFDDCDSFFPMPVVPPPVAPGQPGVPGADPNAAGVPAPPDGTAPVAPDAPAPMAAPPAPAAPPPTGGPAIGNILTTGAVPAPSPAYPTNVIPGTQSPNQGGF